MTLSLLVIDGHDPAERAEGPLVAHLARQSGKFDVAYRHTFDYDRVWSIIWYCGHATWYRSCERLSFERRDGRRFIRLATHEDLARLRADLLVLSSCNTSHAVSRAWQARWLVGFQGFLPFGKSLAFAARFMSHVARFANRRALSDTVVQQAFGLASRVDLDNWFLSTRERR